MPSHGSPRKKILIGVPGFAGIQPEAQEHFMALAFRCGREMPEYDFLLKIKTKSEQFRARNQIVDAAIASGCEYLLMLDDDMMVSPDLVKRLVAHDKELVGALYWQRGGAFHPVVMKSIERENGDFHPEFYAAHDPIIQNPGLHPVDIIGGGCMLFKVDVFRKITPPYFWWEHSMGTDIAICTRLREAGVQPYIDTSIEIGHLGNERPVITRADIPIAIQALGRMKEELLVDARCYFQMSQGELESAMGQASEHHVRQKYWDDEPRDTWESIKRFYQSYGNWHALNLTYYGLAKHPQMAQWLLTESASMLPEGSRILDLGPGVGTPSIHLATALKHYVVAVEVDGAASLDFLNWRKKWHKLDNARYDIWDFVSPVPQYNFYPQDCVIMLSMLDHCLDAYGTLEWAIAQLRPGGLLLCDYVTAPQGHGHDEGQHLVTYDQWTLTQWLREHGMDISPKYPDWMFIKR